jgi:D-alanyl-D-alanine carboxypeptidase/D-alanyl-D-alanine-endopeptidase (penicillin-binding protein 4)
MPVPHLFFEYEFKKMLDNYTLISKNKKAPTIIKETDTIFKTQLIYTHISPKLSKIVYFTNTKSNNHYAESLLKTIGAVKSGKQGSTENGIEAVINFWKYRGVDVSGLHMEDGSGLSRANTITTKMQATVLSKIYRDSTIYTSFNASLPIAGKNGSMINLCKGTFAENNMRAKTGYINRARGYCGYVKTKSGKELAFSVLFNNYDCSPKDMKLKIEKLLVALVDL